MLVSVKVNIMVIILGKHPVFCPNTHLYFYSLTADLFSTLSKFFTVFYLSLSTFNIEILLKLYF